MHELTVAQSLVDMAVAEARRHGATRITRIMCRIGRLRAVDDSLLRDAFAMASEGSVAASAVLDVVSVGMLLSCPTCGGEVQLDGWRFDCPSCGHSDVSLNGGNELELCSIDVEVPDEDRSAAQEPV